MILKRILENFDGEEEIWVVDNLHEAVIGITDDYRLVYSVKACLNLLVKDGMTLQEAYEHFDYNIRSAYVGERTPVWCNDDI